MSTLSVLSDATAFFMLWLFMRAGLHKISAANAEYYADILTQYGMPASLNLGLMARTVGLMEIITALLVMNDITRVYGACMAIVLLTVYLSVMAYQLYQGKRHLDCGCAGSGGKTTISVFLLVRNSCIIFISGFLFVSGTTGISSLLFLSIMAGLFLILFYQSAEQLIGNFEIIKIMRV